MFKKKASTLLAIILLLLCGTAASWALGLWSDRPHFPHSKIEITRADGTTFSFDVEVARDDTEKAYGLMFVHSMPVQAGMIFPFEPPREVAFWMKNTYISLDLLFVGVDHKIGHIATNATPLGVVAIPSEIPVSSVIELNAGQVAQKGFAVGDKVDYAGL